jgi:hypothetical protein
MKYWKQLANLSYYFTQRCSGVIIEKADYHYPPKDELNWNNHIVGISAY